MSLSETQDAYGNQEESASSKRESAMDKALKEELPDLQKSTD
jgi:hypothetical protein